MRPFKVELDIRGLVAAPEHLIHLDDLLAAVAVRRATEMGDENPLDARFLLPLEKHEEPAGWCWKASAFRFRVMGPPIIAARTMRTDYEQAAIANGKETEFKLKVFTQGTGQYKGFDMRHEEQWVQSAYAFGIGDSAQVEEMIAELSQIGGLRKLGYGRIRAATVTEIDDVDAWRYRHMPATEKSMTGYGGIHSPYWDRTQHQPIIEPILEVEHA